MTHETKAGALVSCAFVCLVGGVVHLKMNQVSPPVAEAGSALPPWPTPAEKPAPAPVRPENGVGTLAPVNTPPQLETPPTIQQTAATTPAAPGGRPTMSGNALVAATEPPPAPPLGREPPAPDVTPPAPAPAAPAVAPPAPAGDVFAPENAVPTTPAPAPSLRPGAEPPAPAAVEPPPALPGFSGRDPQPPVAAPPPTAEAPPAITPPPAPLTPTPEIPPAPVAPPSLPPAVPPPPAPTAEAPPAIAPPPVAPTPTPEIPPAPVAPPPAPVVPVATPTAPEPTPMAPPPPPPPPAPISAIPPVPPLPAGLPPVTPTVSPVTAPIGQTPPGSVQIGAPQPGARLTPTADHQPLDRSPQVAQATMPPLGGTPSASTPPVPVLGAPGTVPGVSGNAPRPPVIIGPGVESFDEETYPCRPNETFKSISQLKYHSDLYDRALVMYNRAHPLAAEGVRSEPPVLQAGQPVYIPPVEILQRRYPALVPAAAPPGAAAPAPPAAPPGVGPSTSWSSPTRDQIYQVQGKPETFFEIAQKVYRDGEKWPDIWRLNPEHKNPAQPLAVNTMVRLPAR